MATKENPLAAALAVIGKEGEELESKATHVLRIVRQQKIEDVKSWGKAVRSAYKANGWNGKPGKPKAADKAQPVPATVKQYVSQIRRAFRLKLLVASYTSFYALRQDLKKKAERRAKRAANEQQQVPEMIGIRLQQPAALTGAIFHDLAAIYNELPGAKRTHMLSALDRVKRTFAQATPQLVVASLPDIRKAA